MISLFVLIIIAAGYPYGAHAYLDPGTGSYAIQVLVGVVFGAAYTLRSFGGRIVTGFKQRFGKKQPADTPSDDTEE